MDIVKNRLQEVPHMESLLIQTLERHKWKVDEWISFKKFFRLIVNIHLDVYNINRQVFSAIESLALEGLTDSKTWEDYQLELISKFRRRNMSTNMWQLSNLFRLIVAYYRLEESIEYILRKEEMRRLEMQYSRYYGDDVRA